MKKIFCLILALAMVFSFNFVSFADGPDVETHLGEGVELAPQRVIVPDSIQSISGYASKFVSSSGAGSFTVNVTGSLALTAGLTFKTSCDENNSAYAIITIKRPNGGYLLNEDTFGANEEVPFNFLLAAPGTYTIEYSCYIPSNSTLQMQCWIYNT